MKTFCGNAAIVLSTAIALSICLTQPLHAAQTKDSLGRDCPWPGASEDRFDPELSPIESGVSQTVISRGQRAALKDLARMIERAAECGWAANLLSVNTTASGVEFEIDLARQ